jgi:RNA polymerase sigma-70 factor (ECF subfamily)
MKVSIPELLRRVSADDSAAFAELVERFQERIYYTAYRMLGNHLDADEVVQETFVRVYRRREELANVTNIASFLIRIATNYAIDILRKRRGRSRVPEDPSSLPGEIQIELSRGVKTPAEQFKNKALMEEIWRAMAQLPPKQKITALLHDVEGYSKSEIAQILDCPEATVRSNLHIARRKLKRMLMRRLPKEE